MNNYLYGIFFYKMYKNNIKLIKKDNKLYYRRIIHNQFPKQIKFYKSDFIKKINIKN